MIASQEKQLNNVFERVVRDRNGVSVCVRFIIIDGKVEIVSIEPLVKDTKSEVLSLPFVKEIKTVIIDFTPSFVSKISPYFSLDFLLSSQPTRAPAF